MLSLVETLVDLACALEGLVPAALELARDVAVLRIRGVVLAEGSIGCLGNQSLEPRAFDDAARGTTKVFVDDDDLPPAQRLQTIPHRVLQASTLFVCGGVAVG